MGGANAARKTHRMSVRTGALAALSVLMFAGPALGQEAPVADPPPADGPPPAAEAAPPVAACAPAKKGGGLGALLSAARQAGAGDLLTGRSGALLGSGKRGAIAGAVLGSALGAGGGDGAAAGYGSGYGGSPMAPGGYGVSRKAQTAALAAGVVVNLARSQAAAKAAPCAAP